jgi:hypothetical protein
MKKITNQIKSLGGDKWGDCEIVDKLLTVYMARDRLCRSLDWNESKPGGIAATPEEVEAGANSISICAAEVWSGKLSSPSTNLSRSLRRSATGVFGFMSTRNRRKLPAPSATQTHEPKTNVVP